MSNTPGRLDIVLYRILGNSLPPRHSPRQTLDNLAFILEHEPQLPACEKRWVVNRIVDSAIEGECIRLIEQARHRFIHLPIDHRGEYATRFLDASGMPHQFNPLIAKPDADNRDFVAAAVEWIYRHKNLYAININGARNAALREGRKCATWTLPWDGSCFLSSAGWNEFLYATRNSPDAYQIVVPLARVDDNKLVLDEGFHPTVFDEPQIAFRAESAEWFDERLRYGSRNKAELLRVLGVPGAWQKWNPPPWEKRDDRLSPERGRFIVASWVFRLSSGASARVEKSYRSRWIARFDGAGAVCDELDRRLVADHLQSSPLTCYSCIDRFPPALSSKIANELLRRANSALDLPLVSIARKTFESPSTDQRDYVSIVPGQQVDGQRAGTPLEHGRQPGQLIASVKPQASDNRTWEEFVRRSCSLALAGRLLDNRELLERASEQIRVWFIDPATRMNPNIKYAQVSLLEPERSNPSGVVDFRGFWPLLDAVRLIARLGCMTPAEINSIKGWAQNFLDYLLSAPHCQTAAARLDDVGTWCDLLTCSVAAFVGDAGFLASTLSKAPLRFLAQHDKNGLPAFALTGSYPLSQALFNLSGWISLAWLGRSMGIDLWRYSGIGHRNLATAAHCIAVNRTNFPDYATASSLFDRRITAAMDSIPADAADYDRIARFTSPAATTVFDSPETGLPLLWPALCRGNLRAP
jgi:hypothetical protein